jgi:translation initiation factor IF-3
MRNLKRFLAEGDKAKVTLRFRGREMAHQEIGMRQLERIKADLEDVASSSRCPRWKGVR